MNQCVHILKGKTHPNGDMKILGTYSGPEKLIESISTQNWTDVVIETHAIDGDMYYSMSLEDYLELHKDCLEGQGRKKVQILSDSDFLCMIIEGWHRAGRTGRVIGSSYTGPDGMSWIPVQWDDSEDPDWQKERSIIIYRR